MKYSLGIFNFREEISSLSHSVVFLYFFALIAEEGFLISSCYSLDLCIQMLISFLFTSLLLTAICKASPDSHFAFLHFFSIGMVLIPVSCTMSTKTRLGADCGSDYELLSAKFRLNLKKVGKTTRPFRYDLNQIPYDYTVEVRNRFKGLDLIDRVPDELWTEVCDIVQETGIKTIPMEKKCKKAKRLSGEVLQIAVKRR